MAAQDAKSIAEAEGTDYRLEAQAGFILRKVHQRATEIFNQVMAEFEITPTQFSTLIKLDDVGESSQNRLGRLVATDPATTLGVINRLKKRNLVQLRPDPTHQRRVLVSLTEDGARTARRMRRRAHAVTKGILAPLNARDRGTLLRLLAEIE